MPLETWAAPTGEVIPNHPRFAVLLYRGRGWARWALIIAIGLLWLGTLVAPMASRGGARLGKSRSAAWRTTAASW